MPKNDSVTLTREELEALVTEMAERRRREEDDACRRERRAADAAQSAWLEEKVPCLLFRDSRAYRDDRFAAVDGARVQIRRGETVLLPRKLVLVLEEADRQSNRAGDEQVDLARAFARL